MEIPRHRRTRLRVRIIVDEVLLRPEEAQPPVHDAAAHAGFGDYGIQAYDGERTISFEDQQSQTAKHLVAFLKRVRKRG